jgi:serine/threonine protein kinase
MSVRPLSTLTVTTQTTIEDLKAFQESIGKDDAKLRGKVNRDGSITLKAVDRDSSFLSRIFGRSKKRRDAARTALTQVMTQTRAVDRKPTGSLTALINTDRGHSPRSAALKDLITFAKSANADTSLKVDRTHIKSTSHEQDLLKRTFPSLEAKNLSMVKLDQSMQHAANAASTGPLDKTKVQQYANEIRTDIHAQLTSNGPLSKNDRAMLGVSDIRGYVMAALTKAVPGPNTQDVTDAMNQIADEVTNQLTESLLGTKLVDADTFQLGDEVFKKVETLGQGGFGKAELYRCETTGREVVLKVPAGPVEGEDEETIQKMQFDFKAEIDMHTKIMDNDGRPLPDLRYPHVLEFEGAVRLPNGMFATVTQACTSGDMSKVIKNIDKAVADGLITGDQAMAAKLTLMRDMVDGLSILHNHDFSHRDVKFQNVFVDSKGVGKVADFGETAFSTSYNLSNEKIVENPLYLAPENIVAKDKLKAFANDIQTAKLSHLKAKAEVYNGLVGKGGMLQNLGLDTIDAALTPRNVNAQMDAMAQQIASVPDHADLIKTIINDSTGVQARQLQSAINTGKSALPANTLVNGAAADVWSFGTAVLQSFIGLDKSINAGKFNSTSETKLVEYFNAKPVDPGNGLAPAPLPEALVPGSFLNADFVTPHGNGTVTGDPEIDALINQTLKRDPDDRPTFKEILDSPIFDRKGVGIKETRNLIAALGGNPAKSADEIKNLAALMTV